MKLKQSDILTIEENYSKIFQHVEVNKNTLSKYKSGQVICRNGDSELTSEAAFEKISCILKLQNIEKFFKKLTPKAAVVNLLIIAQAFFKKEILTIEHFTKIYNLHLRDIKKLKKDIEIPKIDKSNVVENNSSNAIAFSNNNKQSITKQPSFFNNQSSHIKTEKQQSIFLEAGSQTPISDTQDNPLIQYKIIK